MRNLNSPLWMAIYYILNEEMASGDQGEIERLTTIIFHAIRGKRR